MKNAKIYTKNKGVLIIIKPFVFLRGKHNEGKKMGQAKNDKEEIFDIYPAECGLNNNCFCAATAKKPIEKVLFKAIKIVSKPIKVIFRTKDGRQVSFKEPKNIPKIINTVEFYTKKNKKIGNH